MDSGISLIPQLQTKTTGYNLPVTSQYRNAIPISGRFEFFLAEK